jgi:hypothetical protein
MVPGGSTPARTRSYYGQDWNRWIEDDFAPAGFSHLLVTFADPFLVESLAGIRIEALPTLEEQLRLSHNEVTTTRVSISS